MRSLSVWLAAPLLAVLVFAGDRLRSTSHERFVEGQRYEDTYYLPPPEWLRVFSLGWDEALADFVWMKALVNFGDELQHGGDASHVFDYTEAMLALDPHFRAAYRWIGTAGLYRLGTLTPEDVERSIGIMERGAHVLPADGELAWDIGAALTFELVPLLHDTAAQDRARARGVPYLMEAVRLGAAPEWAALTNATMLARLGRTEQAVRHLEEVYASVDDPEERARLAEQNPRDAEPRRHRRVHGGDGRLRATASARAALREPGALPAGGPSTAGGHRLAHPRRPAAGALPARSMRESVGGASSARFALALVLLVLVSSGLRFANGFVFDDEEVIRDGSLIHDPSRIGEVWTHHTMVASAADPGSVQSVDTYRPLTLSLFVLDAWLSGASPLGYHLTNLALHLGCVLLVFLLALRWLGRDERVAAFFGAAVFAVHPWSVEAHVWINGRSDPLALLFGLAAMLVLLDGEQREPARARALVAGLLVLLGLLAKETLLLVLPAVVLMPAPCGVRSSLRERLPTHLLAVAPAAMIYLAVRALVLSGLRAFRDASMLAEAARRLPWLLFDALRQSLAPSVPYLRSLRDEYAELALVAGRSRRRDDRPGRVLRVARAPAPPLARLERALVLPAAPARRDPQHRALAGLRSVPLRAAGRHGVGARRREPSRFARRWLLACSRRSAWSTWPCCPRWRCISRATSPAARRSIERPSKRGPTSPWATGGSGCPASTRAMGPARWRRCCARASSIPERIATSSTRGARRWPSMTARSPGGWRRKASSVSTGDRKRLPITCSRSTR